MVQVNVLLVATLAVGIFAGKDGCDSPPSHHPGKNQHQVGGGHHGGGGGGHHHGPIPTTITIGPPPSSTSIDTRCPTVTETATVCGACPLKECAAISSITNKCGCSTPIPTVTTAYPCDSHGSATHCPEGCATTIYEYGASSTCPPSSSSEPPDACPTYISTLGVCSTCKVLECIVTSTLSLRCDCSPPTSIPTVFATYPCGGECPGGCASTSYVYATETPICESPTPGTCIPTVTVTSCPSDNPAPNLCIADAILELPCGCATAASIYSEVVYDTHTPCMACSTGWMYTTQDPECTATVMPY